MEGRRRSRRRHVRRPVRDPERHGGHPDTSYLGDVFLCNAGDVDGVVVATDKFETDAAGVPGWFLVAPDTIVGNGVGMDTVIPALDGPLFEAAGVEAEVTATIDSPIEGAAVASDPTCATPVTGNVSIVTTADFPPTAVGLSGDIGFFATGTSS